MVAGHLREKSGYYYAVLNYTDSLGKRKTKWISTGLTVKGNKKRAEAILMDARRNFNPEEPKVMNGDILFGAFYGLRRSEAIGLKWDAIDFDQNTITIRHTVTSCDLDGKRVLVASDTTKTKSSMRTLPLVPFMRERLLTLKEEQQENRRLCGRSYIKEYLNDENKGDIIIYQSESGETKIDVRFQDETVWLTQAQLCELYQSSKANVSEHIKNIFEEGELEQSAVVRKIRTTAADGKTYAVNHYNLDMIISLGYRIKSSIATQFRRWATERLKEYMIKGFAMDDERLKNLGGGSYWKELLDRIRDIRSSEKVMYRQVLDLYATSVDYDPKSAESVAFFKMVQNKLHYAAHGHTAAEVIFERADAEKPFMGLTAFSGDFPTAKDIAVAKNYLSADELKILNNLVSGYFDFAEIQAMRRRPMYMSDYVENLDRILASTGEALLTDGGTVSHTQAMEKAKAEYRKYQAQNLSPVEEEYLQTIRSIEKAAKEGKKR